ncbi:hypothetical protein WMF11_16915 [Sorangium sp. So ce295]
MDADKPRNPDYFAWTLELSRRGSVIAIANVVRKGAVIDPESADPNVQRVRRLNKRLAAERRVSATAMQTVGSKGYDGLVTADPPPPRPSVCRALFAPSRAGPQKTERPFDGGGGSRHGRSAVVT